MENPDDDVWNLHKCNFCTYRTKYTSSILNHVRQHQTRSKNHQFTCYLHCPEDYQCEICQFEMNDKVFSNWHFNTYHKGKQTKYIPNSVLKKCKNCDFKTYSSLVLLNHHNRCDGIEYHHSFQTSQTEKKKKHSNLEIRPHTRLRRFQCEHCSYKAFTSTDKKKHVLRKHIPAEEINWLKCERCSYKAKEKYALRQHELNRHTEAINCFKCGYCSYKSMKESHLNEHVQTRHVQASEVEKLKRFECDNCSYKATKPAHIKLHVLRKHTPDEEINWLQCEYCSYRAKEKRRLSQHLCSKSTESRQEGQLYAVSIEDSKILLENLGTFFIVE